MRLRPRDHQSFMDRLFGADGDTAWFYHTASGDPIVCEGMDTLVLSQGHQPVTGLEESLRALDLEMHLVGDCLSPRSAEEAIHEGLMVARAVEFSGPVVAQVHLQVLPGVGAVHGQSDMASFLRQLFDKTHVDPVAAPVGNDHGASGVGLTPQKRRSMKD